MNQSSKSFGQIGTVYVQQKVGERAATPSITPTVKHEEGTDML